MSSQINLSLSPSIPAGLLSCAPWLALGVFVTAAAYQTGLWLLLFLPAIAVLTARQFRRCGQLRGPSAVVGLTAETDTLHCQFADGRSLNVRICGSSSLGASALALKLRPEGARSRSVFALILADTPLFAGNAPAQDFRRLRTWLRVGRPAT